MAEHLSIDEFVTELLLELEEKMEGVFTHYERARLHVLLAAVIKRMEDDDV